MDRSELLWVARYHDFQAEMCDRHLKLLDRKMAHFGILSKRAGRFLRANSRAVQQGKDWLKEPAIRPYLEAVR